METNLASPTIFRKLLDQCLAHMDWSRYVKKLDAKNERNCDCGVDGVASLLENLERRLGGKGMNGGGHCLGRALGLRHHGRDGCLVRQGQERDPADR